METLVKKQIIMAVIILILTAAICLIQSKNGVNPEIATKTTCCLVVAIVLFPPLGVCVIFAFGGLGYVILPLAIIVAIGYGAFAAIDASAFWGAIVAAVMTDLFSIAISAISGESPEMDMTSITPAGIVSLVIAPVINFGILYGLPRLIIN